MDNDFKDKLKDESKNNMPDLWDKIESKLEDKKKRNPKKILAVAASLAVIFTVSVIGKNYLKGNELMAENSTSQDVTGEESEAHIDKNEIAREDSLNYEGLKEYDKADRIEVLEDLDLQKILEDKIVLSLGSQKCYAVDPNSIDYYGEAESVVYGKVTDVKSYVKFGGMIISDITIEVIKDYKGDLKEEDSFVMGGNSGGELSYEEFIAQADPQLVDKRGYNNIEDKSKSFVEIWGGIPIYRVGEYVLVYLKSLDNDDYYKEHPELRKREAYDYYGIKRVYVDPNTREVFKYEYRENNTIKKVKAGTLDDIKNIDLSIILH